MIVLSTMGKYIRKKKSRKSILKNSDVDRQRTNRYYRGSKFPLFFILGVGFVI